VKDLAPLLIPSNLTQMFVDNETQIRKDYPIAWSKLKSLHALYERIRRKNFEQAKRIITNWLFLTTGEKIDSKYLYENFTQAISAAKDFKQAIIREFIPDSIRFPFTSDGLVIPAIDPVEILRIIWDPPGDKRYRLIRSFTALVHWNLGIRYLLMRTHRKDYAKQLSSLTLWLEKNMFVGDAINMPFRENVNVRFDPNNCNRFSSFGVHDDGNCLNLTLWYRFIETDDRLIKVLYDSRIKKEEDNFRKTLVKSKAEFPVNHDACAITLVFFSKEDLDKAYVKMTEPESIFGNGAVTSNTKINGKGGKRHNKHSSELSPPEMQFLVYVQGELLEVQLFTFDNYFNRKLSLGPENHCRYRLQQILPLLRILFPADLFINWDEANIYRLLEAFQLAKIRTNYLELLPNVD